MGYYIRVLAEHAGEIPVTDLRSRLPKDKMRAVITVEEGTEDRWSKLALRHRDSEDEIAVIERNVVLPGELGDEEIKEFIAEVQVGRPKSAADWLQNYLPKVNVIYAFQILNGSDVNDGWKQIHAVFNYLRQRCSGISQADGEGFSNKDGSHILWQFSDTAKGLCEMAVLDRTGKWQRFQMDLGDPHQRAAFLEGYVPPGVQILSGRLLDRSGS